MENRWSMKKTAHVGDLPVNVFPISADRGRSWRDHFKCTDKNYTQKAANRRGHMDAAEQLQSLSQDLHVGTVF